MKSVVFSLNMLHLTKGNTDSIYYTASENATISSPRFLFIFEHRASDGKVLINLNPERYSRYDYNQIVVNTYFANAIEGLWKYTIRQKADTSTTETGTIVETGYMMLHPSTEFEPTIYDEQLNTFTIYNGE